MILGHVFNRYVSSVQFTIFQAKSTGHKDALQTWVALAVYVCITNIVLVLKYCSHSTVGLHLCNPTLKSISYKHLHVPCTLLTLSAGGGALSFMNHMMPQQNASPPLG